MKILILYSARSGTNSICDYFLKQNPNYTYFNQPWSLYQEDDIVKKVKYEDCIKYDNVLIKSEVTTFKNFINKEYKQLLSDFDIVLLMNRRNKKEQAISYIFAKSNKNFLSKDKRKYFIDSITDFQKQDAELYINNADVILNELHLYGCKQFYYEDLYYGSFDEIFELLGIKHIDLDFQTILDKKNRYFTEELKAKKIKSII